MIFNLNKMSREFLKIQCILSTKTLITKTRTGGVRDVFATTQLTCLITSSSYALKLLHHPTIQFTNSSYVNLISSTSIYNSSIFLSKFPFSNTKILGSFLLSFTMRTASTLPQLFIAIALLSSLVKPDPDPLQDYCIADTKAFKSLFINGVLCINPKLAEVSHFTTSALSKPGNTSANPFGFSVTLTNTMNLPGLNTLGLTMARADIAANGLVPLHSHPRASEVATLLKGALLVGFIDTTNRPFTQQLRPGDSFVFPKGLMHFLYNLESSAPAVVLSGLNSQNPGAQLTSMATFATKPRLPDDVLKMAFQISGQDVSRIRRNLGG